MVLGLVELATMEYPGRFIIIGRGDGPEDYDVIMYGVTGRSPSSQARRLELNEDGRAIHVRAIDEEVIRQGRRELLEYPAIMFTQNGIVVSNGKQTEDIESCLGESDPVRILANALSNWSYEPDEPNYTPRIGGCLTEFGAALSIIKRAKDGSAVRHYFEVPLIPGQGKLIATYTGVNVAQGIPLPSFKGEPLDVTLIGEDFKENAELVYDVLAPKDPEKDFRVGVVAVYFHCTTGRTQVEIINRCDLGGGE